MWAYAAIAASALVVGFLGSLAGFAGGVILVPLLTLAFGYEIHQAIGSCMAALVPAAIVASAGYLRRGLADVPLAVLLVVPALAATYLGAFLTTLLSAQALRPVFAGLVLALSARLWASLRSRGRGDGAATRLIRRANLARPVYRRTAVDTKGNVFRYHASLWLVVPLGLLAGLSAGLFGVGGGFLTTPVMVLAFGIPVRVAVATSLLMIVVSACAGTVTHALYGHVEPWLALATGIGLTGGSLVGPRVAVAAPERAVQIAVAAILGAVGLGMAVSSIVGTS
jgi:hypothetical protein